MLQLGHFVMNLFPLCLARSRGNLTRLRYQAVTMKCEEVGGAPRSVRPWKPHSTTGSRHTILQSFAAAHEPHQTYPRHMDNELSNTWRNRSCCLYIFSPVLSKTTLQWTLFLLIPFFFCGCPVSPFTNSPLASDEVTGWMTLRSLAWCEDYGMGSGAYVFGRPIMGHQQTSTFKLSDLFIIPVDVLSVSSL